MRRNLLLLAAVAVCGVSLWAGLRERAGGAGPAPTAAPEALAPVHLRVLNATEEPGLARDLGLTLGAAGLVIEAVGNAPGPAAAACLLVNRRLEDGAARALAARLGGVPVVREWDDRCSEDAVLVLGEDWRRIRDALAAPPRAGG